MNAHSLSPEDQQLWLRQWKYAEKELAEQKRKDLRKLSSEQALAMSEILLSAAGDYRDSERIEHSGLVEQQRVFQKFFSKP